MIRRPKIIFGALAVAAAAIWITTAMPSNKRLTAAFLDVGDGLCVVVRTPSGRTMVVDCGTSGRRNNESVGESVAARYLQTMGVDSIDVAVLSHPHADHISGYPSLLQIKPANLVIDSGVGDPSSYYRRFLGVVKKSHAKYRIARRGQVIALDNETIVHILGPEPNKKYNEPNNGSLVLRIVYKRTGILLATDAGEDAERGIIASKAKLRAQVLQVGHHGSRESSSSEWLNAVHPEVAIISCARNSQYGFPAAQTLNRLRSLGARTYTTGACGAVMVDTDGSIIRIHTFGSAR